MIARELVAQLAGGGHRLHVTERGGIGHVHPRGVSLDAAARAAISTCRAELVPLLRRRDEALSLVVRYLAELPVATTLVLEVPGISCPVLWTTSRARAQTAAPGRVVVFTPLEYEVACEAAELGAAGSGELAVWCGAKLRDARWRLTREVALGGRQARPPGPRVSTWWSGARGGLGGWLDDGWTLERALAELGAHCLDVELEGALASSEAA